MPDQLSFATPTMSGVYTMFVHSAVDVPVGGDCPRKNW
jgi:hypothetical protein